MELGTQMFGAALGPLDRVDLDSTGALHHRLGELDLGSWQVPTATVDAMARLLNSPTIAALRDVPAMGEGYTFTLTVRAPTGERKTTIAGGPAPELRPISALLQAQLTAHAQAELAALGPFSLEVTAAFDRGSPTAIETVVIDQTGIARQRRAGVEIAHRTVSASRMGDLATLIRLPAMRAVPGPGPAAGAPVTFVIKRGDDVQTIVTNQDGLPAVFANLLTEVYSERAAFPR
jgi:hypothetical protein